MTLVLQKIVSGGQTGVDRAALDVAAGTARRNGAGRKLHWGGWCPPLGRAEDGTISCSYNLVETPQACSLLTPNVPRSQRTEWNVRDSDATLIMYLSIPNDPGTQATHSFCEHYCRPVHEVLLDENATNSAVQSVHNWLSSYNVETLNIAGPSESTQPGVYDATYNFLQYFLLE
ncbi:expressed unknown protein [Seminavis robusta]|uniref:Uncharacterized protein n=1 Tax=Seminavis robusta TaxID=568900 RepID=A0A9N8EP40_9STRA|nr:expressed unknown protein [Seminavis robusta]|eukprot:Sro1671_g290070.1 n/a (174) ;mRNA; f:14389-14910